MSQVQVAKKVAVHGLCYLNWLILSQQNVTDIGLINQEKQCSKFVTILVYFPKWLSFKIYDKNSSGDEIANVNFYKVRPEATRIRRNNAK